MAEQVVSTKWDSRKYLTAWKLTWLLTILHVVPILVSFLITLCWRPISFSLLPVEWYCGMLGSIWLTYFGVNLAQKTPFFGGIPKDEIVKTAAAPAEVEPAEEDNSGGQPVEL